MIEIRATDSFDRASRSLAAESTGGQLLTDLADEIEHDLAPAVAEVRGALMTAGGSGIPHGVPLLPAIAAGVGTEVILGSRSAGARIIAKKTPGVRGFAQAPVRFNRPHFWHFIYGRQVRVIQVGAPGWFDGTLSRSSGRYRGAVQRAITKSIRRITRRV